MSDEFRHVTVGGKYSRLEFEAHGRHLFDSQAKGDILYASSTTQLSRLGIGATDTIFSVQGGVPTWRTPANILTDLSGQAGAAFDWNGQELTGIDRHNYNETNLLENGNFEVGDPPDGWTLIGGGATVSRSSTQAKIGTYSALLTRNGPDCHIYQAYSGYAAYAGRTVTLGCWVYATEASRVSIGLGDGEASSNSDTHTEVAGWEWLTTSLTVDAGASYLRSYLEVFDGDTSAYFDGAILVEGDSCPAFSPKPVATYGGTLVSPTINGLIIPVVSKSSTYTATTSDSVILCAASSAWTLTLYAASGNSGRQLIIKKTDSSANAVTVDGNASETIDGGTTAAITTQFESITIVCDGSNWHIV